MFGLGAAVGPLLGVLAFEAIGSGVWAACAGVGALAAVAALAGVRDAERAPAPAAAARPTHLRPSPTTTTGASS